MVEYALNSRTEGMGVRATGRVYNTSHATILRWEEQLARQREHWSPPAPEGSEITLEGDELYPHVGKTLPTPMRVVDER
jgi:hypothetical protein